jgi:hypothetical protein
VLHKDSAEDQQRTYFAVASFEFVVDGEGKSDMAHDNAEESSGKVEEMCEKVLGRREGNGNLPVEHGCDAVEETLGLGKGMQGINLRGGSFSLTRYSVVEHFSQ